MILLLSPTNLTIYLPMLSEQLTTPDNVNFKNYLRNPVVPNMSFSQISEEAVMEVLNNLKQKLS